jgi:hypothetical protein
LLEACRRRYLHGWLRRHDLLIGFVRTDARRRSFKVYYALTTATILPFLSRAESTALLLSALAHDVLHPGKNNLFQINSGAEVAKKYNGISVLENQSADYCFALLKKWELLGVLTLDEIDESTASNDPSDSRSEIDVSDADSDGGLFFSSSTAPPLTIPPPPRPTTPKRPTDSPRPGESPRPSSRRTSIASLSSTRRKRQPQTKQAELATMVEDLMLSAILYTDMKSHFQLQDRLEKIIELAEEEAEEEEAEASPFVAAAIRRRSMFPTTTPEQSTSSIPVDDIETESEVGSLHSSISRVASNASSGRRKSVLVVHADDPHPSLEGTQSSLATSLALRRRSILAQHADDDDPHGDDPDFDPGRRKSVSSLHSSSSRPDLDKEQWDPTPPPFQSAPRRPSVQFSDVDEIVRVRPIGPSGLSAVVGVGVGAGQAAGEEKRRRRKSMEFEQRKLLLNALLHAADISNAARP